MRVLAPLIIEIEAKNSKRNETNYFLKYVIKFVSAVWQVCCFICELTATV
jgi:hypothetical protein